MKQTQRARCLFGGGGGDRININIITLPTHCVSSESGSVSVSRFQIWGSGLTSLDDIGESIVLPPPPLKCKDVNTAYRYRFIHITSRAYWDIFFVNA